MIQYITVCRRCGGAQVPLNYTGDVVGPQCRCMHKPGDFVEIGRWVTPTTPHVFQQTTAPPKPKVLHGGFQRTHLNEMAERIRELLGDYAGRASWAEVLGVLEMLKLEVYEAGREG